MNKHIKVRLDSNVGSNLAFNFKSTKNFSDIKIGEVSNVKFTVTNKGNKPENVVSTFNTSPPSAGIHFKKIACFCFEKQTIKPQETREFTVAYYIDPKIVEDSATKGISEITLSYTLFKVDKMYKEKKS